LVTIDADRAFEIIAMNKEGEKPLTLLPDGDEASAERKPYADLLDQENISRFDSKRKKKKRKSKSNKPSEETSGEPADQQDRKPEANTEHNPKRAGEERRRNGRNNKGRDRGQHRQPRGNDGESSSGASNGEE
jgi:hypothetical protein